jgi:hypothetical protein
LFWQKLSSLLWKLSFPNTEQNIVAGWYGNDTTWRMVIDLNKIAEFGKADGTLSDIPQREIYSLCDGIIAGQGDGPLEPTPYPLGIISFTNYSLINDWVMAFLMGLPVEKIPLLNNILINDKFDFEITFDAENIVLGDLKKCKTKATPPKGWVRYFMN